MEKLDSEVKWLQGSGEELVEELLNNKTPIYFLPKTAEPEEDHRHSQSIINKLISTVYSGPTISDVENALSVNREHDGHSSSTPIAPVPDRSLGRIENRYTLRIKIRGDGLADDGYKWRKYGKKSIKNSPNPRSYYRCSNPRCTAKKQVQKSINDPETLIVTYEGLHLHYTYSHFLVSKSQDDSSASRPTPKKAKKQAPSPQQPHALPDKNIESTRNSRAIVEELQSVMAEEDHAPTEETAKVPVQFIAEDWFLEEAEHRQQGLLDDIVPLLVRKPFTSTTSSSDPSTSIRVSSPSHTSSISWAYGKPYLDVDVFSSIV